ncbi:MAG: 2-oxoacid:acceptor oxidoreductase family protein [Desulfobacteraceae bacterium]|nr:2-oxoacid:acceptor oxidoreductase family protein [Desulfobacteraceae bacterium]
MKELMKDPLSMIVIGVAGQGNVVTSFLICNALVNEGYRVTFGQSYPAQQRGGPVINYIRISEEIQASPIIPEGRADVIVAMEPVEAMRMLNQYGNPDVITTVNPRPIQAIDTTGLGTKYPAMDKLMQDITALSAKTWIVHATEEARRLGNPLMANVILVGALVGSGILPLDRKAMEPVLQERFPKAFEINMKALDKGIELVKHSPQRH